MAARVLQLVPRGQPQKGGPPYPAFQGRPGVCLVCSATIWEREDFLTCIRCKIWLHAECHWGRLVSLEEWLEYRRQVVEGPEDYTPVVLCAMCRQPEGPGP